MEKKKYLLPEALIIEFTNDDVITDSDPWWWGPDIDEGSDNDD